MAAPQRAFSQSKEALLKSYNKRLKDDVKSILDNFLEIVKLGRVEEETQVSRATQSEEDLFEMNVRAANIVRAAESLTKLISDIKQYLVLNDFPSVNEAIINNSKLNQATRDEIDRKLTGLKDEMASDLYELEDEYYTSQCK